MSRKCKSPLHPQSPVLPLWNSYRSGYDLLAGSPHKVRVKFTSTLEDISQQEETHLDIDAIQQLVRQGQYEFSIHAQQERLEEDLDVTEIEAALV